MDRNQLVKAEFHCHTGYSRDSLVSLEKLQLTCRKKRIQQLVVTDHNTIEGATVAHQLDPSLFIVGEEIMTNQGELLGVFVNERIQSGLSAHEAIDLLRAQGAFIIVAHPFDNLRSGHWEIDDLLDVLPGIDAIEAFNARCIYQQANALAKEFCRAHHLLATVGSDSHSLGEVGRASLTMPYFTNASELKEALSVAQANVRMSGPWVHMYSSYARWRKQIRSK